MAGLASGYCCNKASMVLAACPKEVGADAVYDVMGALRAASSLAMSGSLRSSAARLPWRGPCPGARRALSCSFGGGFLVGSTLSGWPGWVTASGRAPVATLACWASVTPKAASTRCTIRVPSGDGPLTLMAYLRPGCPSRCATRDAGAWPCQSVPRVAQAQASQDDEYWRHRRGFSSIARVVPHASQMTVSQAHVRLAQRRNTVRLG